jgi:hypothetical protein
MLALSLVMSMEIMYRGRGLPLRPLWMLLKDGLLIMMSELGRLL